MANENSKNIVSPIPIPQPAIDALTKVGNDMLQMYRMGEQFLNVNGHERLRIITSILDGLEANINSLREFIETNASRENNSD